MSRATESFVQRGKISRAAWGRHESGELPPSRRHFGLLRFLWRGLDTCRPRRCGNRGNGRGRTGLQWCGDGHLGRHDRRSGRLAATHIGPIDATTDASTMAALAARLDGFIYWIFTAGTDSYASLYIF